MREGGKAASVAESVLREARMNFGEALKGSLPRRNLAPDMLLPAGTEDKVDAGFIGTLGAFEIYRGKARGHRMANLRLVIR